MLAIKKHLIAAFVFLSTFSSIQAKESSEISIDTRLQQLLDTSDIEEKTKRLHELFDLYWDWRMEENPDEASFFGYSGMHGHWPQFTDEAIDRRQKFISQLLNVLTALPLGDLTDNDVVSVKILKRTLEEDLKNIDFGSQFLLINQMHGTHLYVPLIIELMPSHTVQDFENILSRLQRIPNLFQQTIHLLDKGIELGITPPKIAMLNVPKQVLNQIVEDPLTSPLLKAFNQIPAEIDLQTRERLIEEAKKIYHNFVVPAYSNLYSYLIDKYLPNCRKTIAFSDLPRGEEWYAHIVQSSTTTKLTPREIHDIGLNEVDRIYQEMLKTINSTGFNGSFERFLKFLKTDPQFFYTKREDLLEGYRNLTKHIESKLSLLFEQLPSTPFEVIPIPAYSEESQIGAYYCQGSIANKRPGYFYINTSFHEQRPKWEMEPLALHEAVPGHHLQLSLAQELQGIPDFRKNVSFTAYIEGWGLYAEGLGTEFGLYQDAFSTFGRLSYEMLRAIRLVVDTGMHSLGWSREEAIQFFKKYLGMSDHEIETEVDRYLVMPGQALAYKIGELKIKEMRSLANEKLGKNFDIRAFHSVWLENGTLPLDIAEEKVQQWISSILN